MSDGSPDPIIGWREWIRLPELGDAEIKAKIDTGARTSALHAWDMEAFDRDGQEWMRFILHPRQRSDKGEIEVEAPLIDIREIKPSSGTPEIRPIVATTLMIGSEAVPIELALSRRDAMGFRMLIGREALRRRMIVDPSRSYLGQVSQDRRARIRNRRRERELKRQTATKTKSSTKQKKKEVKE